MDTIIYDNASKYSGEVLLTAIDRGFTWILHWDESICMNGGGNTMYGIEEGNYFFYSCGSNWRDQEKTFISKEKMIECLDLALEKVKADFNKFGYDTVNTKASCLELSD